MGLYTGYRGKGLNHIELLYQPGEREHAVRFLKILGCTVVETSQMNETGSTYICVHPDAEDRDVENNVLYLSEMRSAQQNIEGVLKQRLSSDADLSSAVQTYQHKAKTKPHGIPHFGLRFPSFESIEPVLHELENIDDPIFKSRVNVTVVRPDTSESLTSNMIQAFVFTDIVATGLFCLGQLIELQAQKVLR